MSDDYDLPGMDGASDKEPPPTKTVGQSVVAIVIALVVGTAVVLLLRIHYIWSFVREIAWIAATMGSSVYAAIRVYKDMAGFHKWARMTVAALVLFFVFGVIGMALGAYHFR
jgi:hypothetical protein